jgi:hypothetical protein
VSIRKWKNLFKITDGGACPIEYKGCELVDRNYCLGLAEKGTGLSSDYKA